MAKHDKKRISTTEEKINIGLAIYRQHPLFGRLEGDICRSNKVVMGKDSAATVDKSGRIYINENFDLQPKQWAYVIAHCKLHLAFGHFDAENMPGEEILMEDGSRKWKVTANRKLWNLACDMYITKFLQDMKYGGSISVEDVSIYGGSLSDERKIYYNLLEKGITGEDAVKYSMDMTGLEKPLEYDKEGYEINWYTEAFADALAWSAADAVSISGGHGIASMRKYSPAEEAKEWFINHYPLLGSLASAFKVIYDSRICIREEISIAAVDVNEGAVYINPAAGLNVDELKFVMAHELLHAGLCHHERCLGRDFDLWNASCDYVINGWLKEMKVGTMPDKGLLYDEKYKDWSAESIYDEIVKGIKKNKGVDTFRGYGRGDIIYKEKGKGHDISEGMSLDEFCKRALSQGLEYCTESKRGLIPAGLIEEIRALAMPPVPWDVELAKWFDYMFEPLEKHYTYSRPSRRQGATPDIPRPRYVKSELDEESRTFGVVVDTSCSMSTQMIGMALGSIASFAESKEVPFARVVFCDAAAFDAGYMAPSDIAGRVEVMGRGGTRLQPGIDLLEKAEDFPEDGPILIITDGYIEKNMHVHHEHAYHIPQGSNLPFKAKGKVFRFS